MEIAPASEQLIDDHAAVDRVLQQLKTAIQSGDVENAHAKLDLFWARLAVHIRAEHLHLFPTVLSSLQNAAISDASAPPLAEAQTVVADLRRDHDFFMHELPRAVEIMRKLSTDSAQSIVEAGLNDVQNTVVQVEQRLTRHNEVEENKIYRWATTLLSSEDQAKLAQQITTELRKRPARFSEKAWSEVT